MALRLPDDKDKKETILGTTRLISASALTYLEKGRSIWFDEAGVLAAASADPIVRQVTASATVSSRHVESSLASLGSLRALFPTMTHENLEGLIMARFNGAPLVVASALTDFLRGDKQRLRELTQVAIRGGRDLHRVKQQRMNAIEEEQQARMRQERDNVRVKQQDVIDDQVKTLENLRELGEVRTEEDLLNISRSDATNTAKVQRLKHIARLLKNTLHRDVKISHRGTLAQQIACFEQELGQSLQNQPLPSLIVLEGQLQRGELKRNRVPELGIEPRPVAEQHARLKTELQAILDECGLNGEAAAVGLRLIGLPFCEVHPDFPHVPITCCFASGACCHPQFVCWVCGRPEPQCIVICDRCGRGFHCHCTDCRNALPYPLDPDKANQLDEWYCVHCSETIGWAAPGPDFLIPDKKRGRGGGAAQPKSPNAPPPKRTMRGMPPPLAINAQEKRGRNRSQSGRGGGGGDGAPEKPGRGGGRGRK